MNKVLIPRIIMANLIKTCIFCGMYFLCTILVGQNITLKAMEFKDSNQLFLKFIVSNDSLEELLFPKFPKLGYDNDVSIDMYLTIINCKNDSVVDFKNLIHYSYIDRDTVNKVEIRKGEEFVFKENISPLYPLFPWECYKIKLTYWDKTNNRKITSNEIIISQR
jgi:hypothetical protein